MCFQEAMLILKDRELDLLKNMCIGLSEKKKNFFNEVMQSKRINNNTGRTQARKIVKILKKKVAQVEYVDGAIVSKKK